MITRLAFAQVRANKAYSAWTGSLITLLVAILTTTLVLGATQAELGHDAERVSGWGTPHMGFPNVTTGGVGEESDPVTTAEVAAAIDAASGNRALAVIRGDLWVDSAGGDLWTVHALMGEGAYIPLVEGTSPLTAGDIVLAADVARDTGLDIGDTITLYSGVDGLESADPAAHEYRVVGLAAATSLPGFEVWLPSAYISWDEAAAESSPLTLRWPLDDGHTVQTWLVSIGWTGNAPSLTRWDEGSQWESPASLSLPMASGAWFGAAIMLVSAMVVMGFAVGRSQASARAQWIATVRTLGARRATVAVAAAIEALIVAAGAVVLGLALGVGGAQATLSVARALTPHPFGDAAITMNWIVIPVAIIAAAIAALVVTAVPAFWASRVAPTAALKPVNDLTEAEISRRVPFIWVLAPVTIGATLVWLGNSPAIPIDVVVVAGWIATLVGGVMLVIEMLRRLLPLAGLLLSKRRSPGILSAGDELRARPRQGTASALLLTAGVALVTGWSATKFVDIARWWSPSDSESLRGSSEFWRWVRADVTAMTPVVTVVACALTLQVVIAAIAVSHRGATRAEETARVAMGLAGRQRTRTWWWVQWLPQAIGVVLGLVVGLALTLAIVAMEDPAGLVPMNELRLLVGTFSVGCGGIAGVFALACGAVSAWLTARFGAGRIRHSR